MREWGCCLERGGRVEGGGLVLGMGAVQEKLSAGRRSAISYALDVGLLLFDARRGFGRWAWPWFVFFVVFTQRGVLL